MQESQRQSTPRASHNQPNQHFSIRDSSVHNGHTPRATPSQFDLVVTFSSDEPARQALLSLREAGFGPDQAVLLTRGPLGQGEFELAVDELRAESWVAYGIVVATELTIGILAGSVVGWLIALFHNQPQIGPVWQPILICGFIGLLFGIVASLFEWRRWRSAHLPTPGQAAVALRLRGPSAPQQLQRAQLVLERFGGQRETG